MALATLLNIPSTRDGWSEFSWSNQDSHVKIAQAIFRRFGVKIGSYPLDPIPWFDLPTWSRNHQQWHNEMNAFTGASGADLTLEDVSREDVVANYIRLHANDHIIGEAFLGVT